MNFLFQQKRYKFQVDMCLDEIINVSNSNAVLFAKVRQLEGGSFKGVSRREEVRNQGVQYSAKFSFPCKMNANVTTGILNMSRCRISIRMEKKRGHRFQKLGFVDVNLSEYAGSGPCTLRRILQPYKSNQRLDNSIVQFTVNVCLRKGDPIFQRPYPAQNIKTMLPSDEDRRIYIKSDQFYELISGPSIASVGGSLPSSPESLHSMSSLNKLRCSTLHSSTNSQISNDSGNESQNSEDVVDRTDFPEYRLQNEQRSSDNRNFAIYEVTNKYCRQLTWHDKPNNERITTNGVGSDCAFFGGRHSRQSCCDNKFSYEKYSAKDCSNKRLLDAMEHKKRRQQVIDDGRVNTESVIAELFESVHFHYIVQDASGEETLSLRIFIGDN